jgi:hypothetical protein
MIKIDCPRSCVTQRDVEKSETLTAPNRRPLLLQLIENISRNQCANGCRRLVHKYPTRNPTPLPCGLLLAVHSFAFTSKAETSLAGFDDRLRSTTHSKLA